MLFVGFTAKGILGDRVKVPVGLLASIKNCYNINYLDGMKIIDAMVFLVLMLIAFMKVPESIGLRLAFDDDVYNLTFDKCHITLDYS